jgi:hypothetical protein
VGCGGWSVPLLALSYALTGDDARAWAAVFYSLALVANYPHYMATIYRAYGATARAAHRAYTHYATAVLVALALAAHADVRLLPVLFTAYVVWSPWHYSGQNFGLLLMFAKRGQLTIAPAARRQLRVAFVASYVMLLAAFNEGPSTDAVVLSLELPTTITRMVGGIAGLVFLGCGAASLVPLWRAGPVRATAAPLLLFFTQGLWFVAPVTIAWLTGTVSPQTRYSSGILALMHSAQYLWITQYFARREQGRSFAAWRYWGAVVLGGMALFLPVPWLASYVAHVDFTASVLIVTAVVNLHHFMIDGVVWKLRDPHVARALTEAQGVPVVSAEPPQVTWWHTAATVTASLALLSLAGVDQWRYRLALRDDDPAALSAAARVNPYDSAVQTRLLRTLVERGDTAAARVFLDDLVAASPSDPRVRVNAGVLARQEGRVDDAIRHWRAALAIDGSQLEVQLYLAELLDAQGRTAEALAHYRAYLEHVVARRGGPASDPATVVPIVVKFGDALARVGQTAAARTQFELAVRMARQTGLVDVERVARERLTAAP